jgi:hypothetical protein
MLSCPNPVWRRRPHPEQGFRCAWRERSASHVWKPPPRAPFIGALAYGSVRSILDHKLDRHAARPRAVDGAPILHPNIRGSRYYY